MNPFRPSGGYSQCGRMLLGFIVKSRFLYRAVLTRSSFFRSERFSCSKKTPVNLGNTCKIYGFNSKTQNTRVSCGVKIPSARVPFFTCFIVLWTCLPIRVSSTDWIVAPQLCTLRKSVIQSHVGRGCSTRTFIPRGGNRSVTPLDATRVNNTIFRGRFRSFFCLIIGFASFSNVFLSTPIFLCLRRAGRGHIHIFLKYSTYCKKSNQHSKRNTPRKSRGKPPRVRSPNRVHKTHTTQAAPPPCRLTLHRSTTSAALLSLIHI